MEQDPNKSINPNPAAASEPVATSYAPLGAAPATDSAASAADVAAPDAAPAADVSTPVPDTATPVGASSTAPEPAPAPFGAASAPTPEPAASPASASETAFGAAPASEMPSPASEMPSPASEMPSPATNPASISSGAPMGAPMNAPMGASANSMDASAAPLGTSMNGAAAPMGAPISSNPAAAPAFASSTPAFDPTNPMAAPANAAAAGAAKKPKKTGLIVGIVVGLVVALGAAVAAIWYFAIYSAPEKVVLDAVTQTLSAKNIAFDGSIELAAKSTDATTTTSTNCGITEMCNTTSSTPVIQKATLAINGSQSDTVANTFKATLAVTLADGTDLNFDLNEITLADGKLYVKVNGIKDAITNLQISDEYAQAIEAFTDTITLVDGNWWEISVDSVVETLNEAGANIDGDASAKLNDAYNCAIDAVSNSRASTELVDLYKSHPFVKVATSDNNSVRTPQSGNKVYQISLNAGELTSYLNGIKGTSVMSDLRGCLAKIDDSVVSTSESDEEFEESDVSKALEYVPDVYLEVSNWGHQLNGVSANESNDQDYSATAAFNLTYPASVEVTAPSGVRQPVELYKTYISDMTDLYSALYSKYYGTSSTTKSTTNTTTSTTTLNWSI